MYKKIIPTLYANDYDSFKNKLELLVNISDFIHLDFMDGEFTDLKSFTFEDLNLITKYPEKNFEIHIMGHDPIKYLDKIIDLQIFKVLIHYEVFKDNDSLIKTIKKFKENEILVFLVVCPETDIKLLDPLLKLINGVMIMSVNPGRQGQDFIESSIDKVAYLKNRTIVQIDGGVNKENILKISKAGCDIFSIGSFISSSTTPKSNYELLLRLVNYNS